MEAKSKLVSHWNSADEVASNIDLLTEILLRLPIKSLIKFKAVSKPWLSLISDPGFSRRRSSSLTSASGLFVKRKLIGKEFSSLALSLAPDASIPLFPPSAIVGDDPPKFVIEHSCNGLLLCTNKHRDYRKQGTRYVYNPTTNRYAVIPSPPYPEECVIRGFALAFDPSESAHYKVICVINLDPKFCILSFLVYSSESGSWRSSRATFDHEDLHIRYDYNVVFCNGSIHWMDHCLRSRFAPYFHVETEEIRQVERIGSSLCYYGASRDCFHGVDNYSQIIGSCFTVFELEKDYSRWAVKYRVDISGILSAFHQIPSYSIEQVCMTDLKLYVVCVVQSEIEEDSFLVMNILGTTLRYDFRTGSFYPFSDFSYFEDWQIVFASIQVHERFFEYVESLACV